MGGMARNAQRSPGQAEDRYDASGTISQKSNTGAPQLRAFTRQNLLSDLHHIGAGDVRTGEERIERRAGTRDECCGATGTYRTGNIPRMRCNHADASYGNTEANGGIFVRFWRRFQTSHNIGGKNVLEKVIDASIGQLRDCHFLGRIGQSSQPQPGGAQTLKRCRNIGMGRQGAHTGKDSSAVIWGERYAVAHCRHLKRRRPDP